MLRKKMQRRELSVLEHAEEQPRSRDRRRTEYNGTTLHFANDIKRSDGWSVARPMPVCSAGVSHGP